MKVLVFADVHLRDNGSFPAWNKIGERGFTLELENILKGADFIVEQISEHRPKIVVCAGDLYHTPESLSATVLTASHEFLMKVSEVCEEVGAKLYILLGNHDLLNENMNIHHLHTLGGYGVVVDKVYELDCGLTFVPFMSDKEKFESEMKKAEKTSKLIITHHDFSGLQYETGIKSKSTVKSKYKCQVIAGDIHVAQVVGSIVVPGSLVQNRFNRCDLDKVGGVVVYEYDDGDCREITFIKNTHSKHYIKVEDLDVLDGLSPEQCVLQVKTPKLTEDELKKLEGYEYFLTPVPEHVHSPLVKRKSLEQETPEQILKHHLRESRPEAIEEFDEVMKNAD